LGALVYEFTRGEPTRPSATTNAPDVQPDGTPERELA
jgi:hypothetical protein